MRWTYMRPSAGWLAIPPDTFFPMGRRSTNGRPSGRGSQKRKHEPCLYGWNDGAAHYWSGGRAQSTVLEYDRPARNAEHPTMKPIPLFDRLIRNSCPMGGIVFDPFGGSGTTLLACEQNGRTCWTVELDPRYVQVIINRWEALTGQKAVKVNG